MGKIVLFLFALFAAIAATAPARASEQTASSMIPVLGVDDSQNAIVSMVPLESYLETLRSGLSAIQDSLTPVLTELKQTAAQAQTLQLQTIGVGLSLSGQIGLGPIWTITATPRLRLVFTNSKNPIYPDYN